MTLTADDSESSEHRYIFTDTDFEDDNFNPAQFVARYRRVAPLDSLKDQLRSYSLNIKDQLYEIINKDYKNFIKIATKLDGMDIRIEKLRQPIVNIRMDISSLHDLLLSSLKSIQDKLDEKEKIRAKRAVLEGCLYCMNKLDVAEDILLLNNSNNNHSSSSRRELLGLLNQVQQSNIHDQQSTTVSTTDDTNSNDADSHLSTSLNLYTAAVSTSDSSDSSAGSGSGLSRDVYDSSEYERAAAALASVRGCLSRLQAHSAAVAVSGHAALLRQLDQKCTRLIESLVMKVRVRLCAMFSDDNKPVPRSLIHCLRALIELYRGTEAETAFAETVTLPLARSLLTQGKVDGEGGRGSYAGLSDTLLTLITRISHRHTETFRTCENMFTVPNPSDNSYADTSTEMSSSSLSLILLSEDDDGIYDNESDNITDTESLQSNAAAVNMALISSLPYEVDLLLSGVYAPVLNLLSEKFPGMFSVGIASTFATCYLSIQTFATALCNLVEVSQSSSSALLSLTTVQTPLSNTVTGRQQRQQRVLHRLLSHPATHMFNAQWRLPLYLQLRIQEVGGAVDKLCDQSRSLGPTHSTLTLPELTLTVTVTQTVPAATTTSVSSLAPISQSKSSNTKKPITSTTTATATPVTTVPTTQSVTTTTPSLASVISLTDIATLQIQLRISSVFTTPLISSLATVAALPLHNRVLLPPLAGQLFTFSLRVLCRLEAHLVSVLGIHTTAFPSMSGGGAESGANTSAGTVNESGLQSASSTPLKRTGSLPQVTLTPLTATASSGSSGNQSIHTVDDLLKLCTDLCALITWLRVDYTQYTRTTLTQSPSLSLTAAAAERMIDACVKNQCERIDELRQSVWQRICTMLGNGCTAALTGVAAVTARYRMTNKPPPVQPSPYTHDLLLPLIKFRNQHGHQADVCSTSIVTKSSGNASNSVQQQWVAKVVELIASQYLTRVQALIETVRSMDAALNKRAKLKPTFATGMTGGSGTSASISMSDSEKILLQLYLDVQSFHHQVTTTLGLVTTTAAVTKVTDAGAGISKEYVVPSLEPLIAAVAEGGKFVTTASGH